jgi:hypothetical protein
MVVDHHFDESRPGKPLHLVIPGGLIALGALVLAGFVAYRGWISQTLDFLTAEYLLAGIALVFIAGTFAFSYGYELYNIRKAIRLTLIIVLLVVVSVLIVIVLVLAIRWIAKPALGAIGGLFSGRGGPSGTRSSRSGFSIAPLFAASSGRSSGRSSPYSSGSGDDDDTSVSFYVGGGSRSPSSEDAHAIDTALAAPESWVPSESNAQIPPGPPAAEPPPSWLPSGATPLPTAIATPVTAAPAPIPAAALPPIMCPSCGVSFVPIAGKPPVCPNCGAGFAAAPTH